MTSSPEPQAIAERIVRHFRSIQRDLPWRQTRDPYAIWISEIMLQQTRVATVIPYYQRWLERFPTVRALAEAPLDDVLAAWSGLGYYTRARNLHRCAGDIVSRHGGSLPDSASALRELPGIGRYTAGAIASIAFGRQEPVVDGNVARVLARIYELEIDIKSSAGMRELWKLAGSLVPAESPSDFNQGLMELGATVCTPRGPSCLVCPVGDLCRARAAGRQGSLPIVPARKKASELPLIDASALWIWRRGRLLLARRAPQGLYGGLWELPQTEDFAQLETIVPGAVRLADPAPIFEHRQVLSHRQLRIRVFRALGTVELDRQDHRLAAQKGRQNQSPTVGKTPSASYSQGSQTAPQTARYVAFAWHTPHTLADLGLSSATQRIIDQLKEKYRWKKENKPSSSSPKATTKSSRG